MRVNRSALRRVPFNMKYSTEGIMLFVTAMSIISLDLDISGIGNAMRGEVRKRRDLQLC